MKILLASHDAGGAEVVSAWARRQAGRHDLAFLLAGPARAVFARKGLGAGAGAGPPGLHDIDLLVCGTSGAASLERDALRAARSAGVPSVAWLDHWVNFPARFEHEGRLVLPDEVRVSDEHAERIARATLPGAVVRRVANPYLEDVVEEIRAQTDVQPVQDRVLYVTEPRPDQATALEGYLAHLARGGAAPAAVRIRTHPSEPPDAYGEILARWSGELALERSAGSPLSEDCAWAGTVAGCDTMAMVVGLAAGRRVVSVIPPGGSALSLPFDGIERLWPPGAELGSVA